VRESACRSASVRSSAPSGRSPAEGAAHRTPTRRCPPRLDRHVWLFLAHGLLAAKTLAFERWKSLDVLGFSRPNRAFSMGYAGFSLKEISRALLPATDDLAEPAPAVSGAEGWNDHETKLSSLSDFLQEIAVEAVPSLAGPRLAISKTMRWARCGSAAANRRPYAKSARNNHGDSSFPFVPDVILPIIVTTH
jgi:hypothetical protein